MEITRECRESGYFRMYTRRGASGIFITPLMSAVDRADPCRGLSGKAYVRAGPRMIWSSSRGSCPMDQEVSRTGAGLWP